MSQETTRPKQDRSLFSVAQIQHLLRVEFGRARRYGYPLSVVVLAVDQLGALRDRLGFEAKESVLDAVVALLFESTRASDFLGRTPDDRLLAVLPHTDVEGARQLAERLLARVRALQVPAARGERLTLSLGLSATHGEAPAFHDVLMTSAEAAQAESAAQGGDRLAQAG